VGAFIDVPERARYWLRRGRVPAALLAEPVAGLAIDEDGLALVDIEVTGAAIGRIAPAGASSAHGDGVDVDGGQIWPCFADLHTHLDKGHIWQRAPNPDGTFAAALSTVAADRVARWSPDDVFRRMAFGLRCSYAHGTRAVRTHLDSQGAQLDVSWPVMRALRQAWVGRIELQAVSLVALEHFAGREGEHLADVVADSGGVLGGVAFMSGALDGELDRIVALATERGLDLDFHVDESGDQEARAVAHIARAVLRRGFAGRVVCGHCCSLAMQPPDIVDETLHLIQQARIGIVALPMSNLYLQDRRRGQTPRWRGVTLLHEMKARSIAVAVASDNCRDPFNGFGDHDLLEVFREAVRIAHLDRPYDEWPRAIAATPADLMGLETVGRLGSGRPADLVLFRGRHWSELLARPQSDRVVIRGGRAVTAALPDYRELDELMTTEA
jgi:cytosine deaminase